MLSKVCGRAGFRCSYQRVLSAINSELTSKRCCASEPFTTHEFGVFRQQILDSGERKDFQTVIKLYEEYKASNGTDNHCLTVLIKACKKIKDRDILRFIQLEMTSKNVTLDIHIFNKLIWLTEKLQDYRRTSELVKHMKSLGIEPDLETDVAYIVNACANNNFERAETIFDSIREAGKQPTKRMYACIINEYGKRKECSKAFTLLADMKRQGLQPDKVIFTSLIVACGRTRQLENAFEILSEMQECKQHPDIITYTSLISACIKSRKPLEAFRVYEAMKSHHVTPDAVVFSKLTDICFKQRNETKMKYILQEIKKYEIELPYKRRAQIQEQFPGITSN